MECFVNRLFPLFGLQALKFLGVYLQALVIVRSPGTGFRAAVWSVEMERKWRNGGADVVTITEDREDHRGRGTSPSDVCRVSLSSEQQQQRT